jgi:hypothetical protein
MRKARFFSQGVDGSHMFEVKRLWVPSMYVI